MLGGREFLVEYPGAWKMGTAGAQSCLLSQEWTPLLTVTCLYPGRAVNRQPTGSRVCMTKGSRECRPSFLPPVRGPCPHCYCFPLHHATCGHVPRAIPTLCRVFKVLGTLKAECPSSQGVRFCLLLFIVALTAKSKASGGRTEMMQNRRACTHPSGC